MSLNLSRIVQEIIQKYITYPIIIFSVVIAILFFGLLTWEDRVQNNEIIEGNNEIIHQYIISGDSVALRRHLKSMVAIGRWRGAAVYHINRLELASAGNLTSCSNEFYIKSSENEISGKLCYQKSFFSKRVDVLFFVLVLLFGVVGTIIFALYKAKELLGNISHSFEILAEEISQNKVISRNDFHSLEERHIVQNFNQSFEKEILYRDELIKAEKEAVMGKVAMQVSHDIRSPLAALNMMINPDGSYSENNRVIIKNAVQRINDIANELLDKGKASILLQGSDELSKVELLSAVIESIVSEKRIQFREKQNIEIDINLSKGYGLFANINTVEFKRALSNCLNNSIEAFLESKGKIIVSLKEDGGFAVIEIKDNGKGIPQSILDKLGQKGITHGKDGTASGSGLGVYYTKKVIENLNGIFEISSIENQGTSLYLKIPKSSPPHWFVKEIRVPSLIVSLDDDITIHQIWKERFKNCNVSHLTFTSALLFKEWIQKKSTADVLYLIDYEFLNQNMNGLELIEELNIAPESVLVTSRYEELDLKIMATSLNFKILPKSMAPIVPIYSTLNFEINNKKEFYDCVLIDDDSLIQIVWENLAKKKNKSFVAFSNSSDFYNEIHRFDLSSNIYFDSELGNGARGEIDSKKAYYEFGFRNIYLCTGHKPEDIIETFHLKGILGKKPPF